MAEPIGAEPENTHHLSSVSGGRVVRKEAFQPVAPKEPKIPEDAGESLPSIDKHLHTFAEGQAAAEAIPMVSALLEERNKAIDTEVFHMLTKGQTIDPEYAVQAWIRKFALAEILQNLTQKRAAGRSASKKIGL